MADGYGDGMPSWALAPPYRGETSTRWMMAKHLRLHHGEPYHKIAKFTGLPYNEVRIRLREEEDGTT